MDKTEKRGQVLLEAHRTINGERQQRYGSPEDSHAVIADMWNGYLAARRTAGKSKNLDATDVAHMMVQFKLARQLNGAGKLDNYVDAAGYIGIAADMQDGGVIKSKSFHLSDFIAYGPTQWCDDD